MDNEGFRGRGIWGRRRELLKNLQGEGMTLPLRDCDLKRRVWPILGDLPDRGELVREREAVFVGWRSAIFGDCGGDNERTDHQE